MGLQHLAQCWFKWKHWRGLTSTAAISLLLACASCWMPWCLNHEQHTMSHDAQMVPTSCGDVGALRTLFLSDTIVYLVILLVRFFLNFSGWPASITLRERLLMSLPGRHFPAASSSAVKIRKVLCHTLPYFAYLCLSLLIFASDCPSNKAHRLAGVHFPPLAACHPTSLSYNGAAGFLSEESQRYHVKYVKIKICKGERNVETHRDIEIVESCETWPQDRGTWDCSSSIM